jgi:ubiquinone/menaquinone biosynthesis C-methylase UbiE
MSSFEKDKLIERDRYDQRAHAAFAAADLALGPDGPESQALVYRRPYLAYERFILDSVTPGCDALDICCGTGLYSLIAARAGASVVASDIAEGNLVLAQRRAVRAGVRLSTAVSDAEHLCFGDETFDLITCAGSLSYTNLDLALAEIQRILRPNGWFVCVDSLNHNPFYRLNRYFNYIRGRRSYSTILRMPTLDTIAHLERNFRHTETQFYGTASFLAPCLTKIIGNRSAATWLDAFDSRWPILKKWAFKFVFRGRKVR